MVARCAPVSGKLVAAWSNVLLFHAIVVWQALHVVGNPAAWCGGFRDALYAGMWQAKHSTGRPTNVMCPCCTTGWQEMQSAITCAPESGKRVSWWRCCITERSMKLRGEWQVAQSEPSSPWCTSLWQTAHLVLTPLNSSDAWHARQFVCACAPSSGKTLGACLNDLLTFAGFHAFGAVAAGARLLEIAVRVLRLLLGRGARRTEQEQHRGREGGVQGTDHWRTG